VKTLYLIADIAKAAVLIIVGVLLIIGGATHYLMIW
jgi:hypothetical protein